MDGFKEPSNCCTGDSFVGQARLDRKLQANRGQSRGPLLLVFRLIDVASGLELLIPSELFISERFMTRDPPLFISVRCSVSTIAHGHEQTAGVHEKNHLPSR
ncbi:unnamed protein product [Soboliphyme baturini]|uniref:Uncharacterized protein n=1 Tax=Soboliphyme baturini TaxID=241478 RepID=A0A183IM41_9BILA|nr:unnamed protein product [Soboliphyme baturini]